MVNYNHPPKSSKLFDGKLYQKMSDDLQLADMSKQAVHVHFVVPGGGVNEGPRDRVRSRLRPARAATALSKGAVLRLDQSQ